MARSFISPAFSRALLDGHSLLGVIFGAIVYVVCLSGTVVVLVDQLAKWESPAAPEVVAPSPAFIAQVADRAYAEARRAHADHDIFIALPTRDLPRVGIYGYGEKGETLERAVDASGTILPKVEMPWLVFLQNLHFNLTIPGQVGRYLVGIVGTILLASIVSGLLAHRRILKDAFRLRWGGARRLANADLHNRVGVWALPFHLIVSLTGSLLGLAGLIIMVLALVSFRGDQEKAIAALLGPQPTEDSRPAPLPDVRPMLATVAKAAPGATPMQVRFEHPGTRGQQVQIFAATPGHLTQAEGWTFAGDGRLKAKAGLTDGNVGTRIYGMITPLHYGTYGGIPLKLIYVALGAGLTIIVATGGNIWLARRRDQGRAAPGLERLWAAVLWGQPAILLLCGIGALLFPALPLVALYWGGTLALLGAATRIGTAAGLTRALKALTGGLCIALAATHAARFLPTGPEAIALDIALVVLGATLLRDRLKRTAKGLPAAPSYS